MRQKLLSIINGGCSDPWSFVLRMLDIEDDQSNRSYSSFARL
jgi:hypothetical protein